MQRTHAQGPELLVAGARGKIVAGLAVSALAIVALGQFTDIDLRMADAAFDAVSGQFPWRHTWLAERFNHEILKGLLTLLGVGFIAAALLDAIRPLTRLSAVRRLQLRVVACSALGVPLVISSLKQVSVSHCPWDLARYGGEHPYLRLLDALPAGVTPGHCLPAGHASSALWLLALAVYWLPAQGRMARGIAVAGLLFGALVGFVQQLRGAHFMTHTLWSMWISAAVVLGLVYLLQRLAASRPVVRAAHDRSSQTL